MCYDLADETRYFIVTIYKVGGGECLNALPTKKKLVTFQIT